MRLAIAIPTRVLAISMGTQRPRSSILRNGWSFRSRLWGIRLRRRRAALRLALARDRGFRNRKLLGKGMKSQVDAFNSPESGDRQVPKGRTGSACRPRYQANALGRFYDEAFEHPAQFGMTNMTDRWAGRALFHEDPKPCALLSTYHFFHDAHPSAATYRAMGLVLSQELMDQSRRGGCWPLRRCAREGLLARSR